jgi:hypothetical protein
LRILIDESLPRSFAAEFAGHNVSTVPGQRWNGLQNGVLLHTAAQAGFDVFLTGDRSLPHQQNLAAIGISVLVLTGVRYNIEELRLLTSQVLSILPLLRPGDAYEIAPLKGDAICDRQAFDLIGFRVQQNGGNHDQPRILHHALGCGAAGIHQSPACDS